MTASLLLALGLLQTPESPAAVVRHALAAVEGDSVARVAAVWQRRVARDSTDRTALLGLASLAHHTYDDSLAAELYHQLAAGADVVAAYAALGLARLFATGGNWVRSDSAAQQAVALARASADRVALGAALVVLAAARRRTGGADAASFVAEARQVLPDTAFGERARAECARAQLGAGVSDDTVLSATRAGIELATRGGDLRARGTCYHTAASVYTRRGPAESAMAFYRHAEEDFRQTRDRGGLSIVLQWRGYYRYLIGTLGYGWRDCEASVREAEASHTWLVVPWARSCMANIALALGDHGRAALNAAEATRLFARQGDRYATANARALEANLAFALGDTTAARVGFEASLQQVTALGWLDAQVSGWEGLLQVALARHDLATAHRALDSLVAVARRGGMRGRWQTLPYYEGTLALMARRYALAERLLRRRRAASEGRQGNWEYLGAALLAEALVHLGRLAEAESEIRYGTERLDAWRQHLSDSELRKLAFQLAQHRADPDVGVATVIAELARSGHTPGAFEVAERGRARDLADRLNRAAALDSTPAATASRAEPAITLGGLILEIPDSLTAVLEYVTGLGDPTTLFVVTQRGARAYVLPSQDSLRQPIARLAALVEAGEDAGTLGRELGDALLGAALAQLDPGIRRLVIVPDGPLHRVPFDVLVMADDRFVVERFAVATAPSATIAARLWRRRATAPATGLLALADPRFATESDADIATIDVFRTAASGTAALPRLRGSGREAQAVARYSDHATVRRRAAASEQWLKQNPLTSYGVLHFATHALVDEGSIANTALALAPEGAEDGFVRPAELAALGLQAELVVLSACRTAGGVIVRGEGIQGLAAPLLAAGARAVAATWWPIGDEATVRLVEDFYAGMARGLPVADALQEAKLAALARGAPAREWAAFTIVGDPLARPVLRTPPPAPPLLPLGLLLLVAALAVYGFATWKRRNSDRASVPSTSSARTQ